MIYLYLFIFDIFIIQGERNNRERQLSNQKHLNPDAIMADAETNRDRVIRAALTHYINNGLARDINVQNRECYRTMMFVDYADGVVRVLVGGEDPQTQMMVSRDVLIDGFVRIYVRPLILNNFPDVTTVKYIKTTDEDFDEIVGRLGGTVLYSDYWSTVHSFPQCMELFADNHPLLQGCRKGTFLKDPSLPRNADHLFDGYTTPSFFNKWDLGWWVTNETHVLCNDGVVYWGLDQIRDHRHLLPPHLTLIETPAGPDPWILFARSAQFFTDVHFKIIDFS